MRKLARLCLLVVLSVSLPLHAAYGVSMAQCMAREQAVTQVPHLDSSAVHASNSGCDHAERPGDASDSGSPERGAGQPHCGSCSHCGTSTALVGSLEPLVAIQFYFSHPAFFEQRLQSVIRSRLDRPPLAL